MEYPEFVSLNWTALRLVTRYDIWHTPSGKEYRRFMGWWALHDFQDNGVYLLSVMRWHENLHNQVLVPITAQEWWDDDGGDYIDISLVDVPHKLNVWDIRRGKRVIQIFANKFPSQVKWFWDDIVFYNTVPEVSDIIYRAELIPESNLV